jgi:hypothetical protein
LSSQAPSGSVASPHGTHIRFSQIGAAGSVHSSLVRHPIGPVVESVSDVTSVADSLSLADIDIDVVSVGSFVVAVGAVSLIELDVIVVESVPVSATPSHDGSSSNV